MRKRQNFKKVIMTAAVLAGVLCLLSGCAGSGSPETTQASAEAETPAETKSGTGVPEQTETAQTAAGTQAQAETAGTQAQTETAGTQAADYTFAFTRENFPKMDGSTATVPLGKAIAGVLLGESPEAVEDLVKFNKTTQSFRNLKNGSCDILVVGEPNAAVFQEMEEEGFRYEAEEIATDALIFVVNEGNPVSSLTTQQIRDIYSGKITNWKEVGGNDAEIVPFQRNEGAGSQALMLKHVMKDTPLMDAPGTLVATEMGELMDVVRSYDNSANAIGYSVYYYANDMKKAEGLKIIAVDGVDPEPESIRNRQYPHLNAYYGVIPADTPAGAPARILYEWLLSREGQALLESEGYVNAEKPENCSRELADGTVVKTDYTFYRRTVLPDSLYTRLAEEPLTVLAASDGYGCLLPYSGELLYNNSGDGYAYTQGTRKGFMDEHGTLLTDPVFSDISALSYYDTDTWTDNPLPVWKISRIREDYAADPKEENYRNSEEATFATMDGRMVCDRWYPDVYAIRDHILCVDRGTENEPSEFDIYDLEGNPVFTSRTWKEKDRMNEWSATGVEYGEGLFRICFAEGVCYFDENGRITAGPFDYAMDYKDGTAVAAKGEDYRYGLIDTEGNWLIEPAYSQLLRLDNGGFAGQKEDETVDVFGKDRRLITTVEAADIFQTDYGFSAVKYGEYVRCFDWEGKELAARDGNDWQLLGRKEILYRQMGAGVSAENFLTGKKEYFEGFELLHEMYRAEDTPRVDYFVAENSWYEPETGRYYSHCLVLDKAFGRIAESKDGTFVITQDRMTGDWYYGSWKNSGRMVYYDSAFRECITLPGSAEIVNGKFICRDEYACTCYDRNGSIVFRYSLLNSLGD